MRQKHSTTRLPRSILDQIENSGTKSSGSKQSLKNTLPKGRKERRKQERLEKRQTRQKPRFPQQHIDTFSESDQSDEEPQVIQHAQKPQSQPVKADSQQRGTAKRITEPTPATDKLESKQGKVRKAVADKLDEDDAEIAALEKKLNIKGNKLPSGFKEDNLDWLLDGLDSENEEKEKDREYLAEKRGKKRKRGEELTEPGLQENGGEDISLDEDSEDYSEISEGDLPDDSDVSSAFDIDEDDEMPDIDEEWSGMSPQDEEELPPIQARTSAKPDPTKPAIPSDQPAKYIPPAQRRQLSAIPTDDVLRKKIQGQVNRLTEQSMLQTVKFIEELYRDHPRQSVTSTLSNLVLASVSNEVNTKETFFTLYGGFVAALYKILGTDFGAFFAQSVVEEFDKAYEAALAADEDVGGQPSTSKKQANDLISLIAELYNFGVIGSTLIFDLIRIFVSNIAELNAELLLRIVRSSGPQLRQDDPSAMKDIVSMLNSSVAKVGTEKLSIRFKFMVETLTNLKNNKNKKSNDSSVVASEAIVRMKKTLGTLNSRSLRASEPLRPSLKDIRDVETKGKWWLIGASWRNNMVEDGASKDDLPDAATGSNSTPDIEDDITNYAQLAREQRMNTEIRRAVFVAIMSSEDYVDARERLMKLRLKRSQEREIPHVLLHCCGNEAQYNPYYTLIAQQLCSNHSLRMTFQFSLWGLFRKMGEEDDMNRGDSGFDENGEEEQMPLRKVVNLAKLYGYLVANGSLSLMILKTLQIVSLQPITKNFLEIFFITVFSEIRTRYPKSSSKRETRTKELFSGTVENHILARGLELFLKEQVANSDIINSKLERRAVREGCVIAESVLKMIILDGADEEL